MSDFAILLHKLKATDCGSDHNPIVIIVRVKLRKLMRKKSQPKLQSGLLRSEYDYRKKFRQHVSARITGMVRQDEMETRYTEFRNILIEATEQIVPVETRRANQRSMTNEIKDMMEERRLLKHNQGLYREKDTEIQRECHKAKYKNVITAM